MKYIDLERELYIDPVTKKRFSCSIKRLEPNNLYYLSVEGPSNALPLTSMGTDLYTADARKAFFAKHNIKYAYAWNGSASPEFHSREEAIAYCEKMNELLTIKYEGCSNTLECITLEFE